MKKLIFILFTVSSIAKAQTIGFNTFVNGLPSASNITGATIPIVQGGISKQAAASLFGSPFTATSHLFFSSNILTIQQSTTSQNGYLSNIDWNTFNNKQGALTLTTTGTSGAATFIGNTLNIPQYSGTTTLSGLTDVNISSPSNNQFLRYKTSDNKWHNDSFVAGTDYVATETDPVASAINGWLKGNGSSLSAVTGTGYPKFSGTSPTFNATIPNADLTNSSITISGNSTSLGGTVTQDQITGLLSTGLIKRTGANTLAIASSGTDYLAPFGSQTANFFYAAPNGSSGTPSFRAIVGADIPTLNQNTTGSAGSVVNALSISAELISGGASSYNGSAAKSIGIQSASVTNAMLAGGITDANLATSYLKADGSRALTGNWAAGNFNVTGIKALSITGAGTTTNVGFQYFQSDGTTNVIKFQDNGTVTHNATLGTVGSNNVFALNSIISATSRSNASDAIGGYSLAPTITANSTSIDAQGGLINFTPKTSSGITTGTGGLQAGAGTSGPFVSKSVSGMSVNTFTNIAPSSTSGSGTGALWTIITATATTFTSFSCTTSGSGYNVGETVTFNGSLFGGSGTIVLAIISTVNSFGSNAVTLRLQNNQGEYSGLSKNYLNLVKSDGSTVLGSIGVSYAGNSGAQTATLFFNDPSGSFMTSDGTTTVLTRNITVNGTHSVTGSASVSTFSASNSISSTWVNSNSNASSFDYSASGSFQINTASQVKGAFGTSTTLVLGIPSSVSVNAGGSGYSNGQQTTTGGTGNGLSLQLTTSGGVITAVALVINAKGSGYSPGDVVNINGGTGGKANVLAVDQYGGVVALAVDNRSLTDATSNQNYPSFYSAPTYTLASSTASTWGMYYNPTYTSFGTGTKGGFAIVPTGTVSGIGTASPTAGLDLQASTSSIASFRIRSGTAPSSPNDGEMWYDGTNLFIRSTNNLPFAVNYSAAAPATTGTMTTTLTNVSVMTITPTGACTFNASGGKGGQECTFVITTSGTSAFTLTWGTNFKTTGTLSTGTVSGKVFTVSFAYDGTNWNEQARTPAM